MKVPALFVLCLWALLPAPAPAQVSAEDSATRAPTGEDLEKIHEYSDQVGKGLLRQELGLDLDSLRLKLDTNGLRLEDIRPRVRATPVADGSPLPSQAPGPALLRDSGVRQEFSLALDQSGDLLRLRNDVRDIPFGVKVRGQLPLLDRITGLSTELWVPFSWRDELKAEASLPLPHLKLGVVDEFLTGLGLADHYALRSEFTNRLGVNQLGAGVGTQWSSRLLGVMDLNYDYSQRSGQGLEETVHYLKLRKDF
jgi:hypothetical protein